MSKHKYDKLLEDANTLHLETGNNILVLVDEGEDAGAYAGGNVESLSNLLRSLMEEQRTIAEAFVRVAGEYIAGRVADLRILAMERTMMERHGIRWGDTVLVEGAGAYDGEWLVVDTMSARYAGQDRVDFLVSEHIKLGRWEGVKIYKQR